MSAHKLANDFEIPLEEAEQFIKSFYNAYPRLKKYFQEVTKRSLTDGYITIDELTGRISHNDSLQKKYEESLKVMKSYHDTGSKAPSKVYSDYYTSKGKIQRNSQNFPIQGTAASMTKIASILVWEVIRTNNLFHQVRHVVSVHDELALEVSVELSEWAMEMLGSCMEKAGKIFLKSVPIKSDGKITKVWDH